MTRFPGIVALAGSVALSLAAAGCGVGASARSPVRSPRTTTTTVPVTTTTTGTTTTVPVTTTTVPVTTTTAPATPPTTATPFQATTTSTLPPAISDAGGCPSDLADALTSTGGASQLLTVVSKGTTSTYATLTAWVRQGRCWAAALGPFTARIGAAGFSDHKHEGDDTTPTGAYGIGPTMYGNAPDPGTQYPYHRLVCGDWWDETPGSPTYNTLQSVPCGTTPPFGGDSEALWTETVAYSSLAVIEYNADPVVPGAGSAIFLHATLGAPSTGCVTVPLTDLDRVLAWLDPADSPLIVLGPSSEIEKF